MCICCISTVPFRPRPSPRTETIRPRGPCSTLGPFPVLCLYEFVSPAGLGESWSFSLWSLYTKLRNERGRECVIERETEEKGEGELKNDMNEKAPSRPGDMETTQTLHRGERERRGSPCTASRSLSLSPHRCLPHPPSSVPLPPPNLIHSQSGPICASSCRRSFPPHTLNQQSLFPFPFTPPLPAAKKSSTAAA